ncbi:hypothetical protein E2562_022057 [Oryza meyeriana var. granulata]|uniref:Uncharacterized protein n=1 Tax=Oryza meyeriana var. granulata TaxID=110450 RepID=A0A6G1ENL0_9ORYZ|nr:hypothetical protein E2562_022057 [Oryza meyeriana var. granulata]
MVPAVAAVVARTRTLFCVPVAARAPREMAAEVAAATALDTNVTELQLDRLSGFAPRGTYPSSSPSHARSRPSASVVATPSLPPSASTLPKGPTGKPSGC